MIHDSFLNQDQLGWRGSIPAMQFTFCSNFEVQNINVLSLAMSLLPALLPYADLMQVVNVLPSHMRICIMDVVLAWVL